MTRILAVADEVDEALYEDKLERLRPDLIVSCGDLPFEYLENLVSRADVPLVFVPGNHDPDLRASDSTWRALGLQAPALGPPGCDNADGRVLDAAGLRIAGLGGAIRYNRGPNQYTQAQMRFRGLGLAFRIRLKPAGGRRSKLDVLLTHAPPFGWSTSQDAAHIGFIAFHRMIKDMAPKVLIHGHVHPYGRSEPTRRLGTTLIVNAVPSRLVEV
jgi:calcineurin-like phosphoesterase family protein